ncbi:Pyridoxal phosphate-dependent transferase, major domain protein [Cordyceps fumosorosea ARSEF 2679]|uniref:Pyridoxal phosphate-dependent transferase, major domain protein n=1 Tax=Cordyceps fumosorosea (strain ARSEF 2679) TaxID=1081104 RepID=A0A167VRU9_CORFA|nr:Pyridoxal phosphate-dependent transferase, major domain protein [Cordyceps fumosorosea ARSEF 2679]OAA62916.1 Pyridoxal phosphate-dependent transferase, major domain protein [Cordyceps fumosorosea ARSEF 2679]
MKWKWPSASPLTQQGRIPAQGELMRRQRITESPWWLGTSLGCLLYLEDPNQLPPRLAGPRWPAPELLPAEQLAAACQRVLRADPAVYTPVLEYGADEGYEPLRRGLAAWLARHYRVTPDPRRICITGGASQNLACLLQSFTDVHVTRAVWAVAPVYHLAVPIFNDAGFGPGRVHATPEDEDGVDVDALERKIRALEREEQGKDFGKPSKRPDPKRKFYRHLIYVVPTCANPSGKSMPVTRREALVQLARRHDALIVCDDVYDFLQWPLEGPVTAARPPEMRLPRLCDIDLSLPRAASDPAGFRHTVSNGSFSKISGPGVRTGWAEASPAFAAGLASTGSTRSGGAPSQLCAGMLCDLVDSGALERSIDEVLRPALQRRHRLLLNAVRARLAPRGVTLRESSLTGGGAGSFGGYFLWLGLGEGSGYSADLVAHVAREEENVIIGHGNMFTVQDEETRTLFEDRFRLCFSWLPEKDLEEGVERLEQVLIRIEENREHYRAVEDRLLGENADMKQHV